MTKMKYIISIILFLLGVNQAFAISTIQINRGHYKPTPIALNEIDGSNNEELGLGSQIRQIIEKDLNSCGLFRSIPTTAFIDNKVGIQADPLFAAWRQINAAALLNASVKKINHAKFEISFVLWDCFGERDIAGEIFEVPAKLWRKAAHKIADKIYERITGDKGYFDTRIAYIAETGSPKRRIKRVAVMDQDGGNHQYLTSGKNLVLTPRFSPKGDRILYLSYSKGGPKVHMKDLRTGQDILVGHFPGMSFAPRFSPDGTKALMSVSKDGATNIYEIELDTMRMRKLTNSTKAINTSPSYTPEGNTIIFNSDRGGSRQLYKMNSDGSNVARISFGSGRYATPAVSPRGDYIAFTKIIRGEGFFIGVMRLDGSGERLLANQYLVEGPTWSSNGRVVIFTEAYYPDRKGESRPHLKSIDITGYNERLIETPHYASDPAWSVGDE
jgi:TolB protein